MSEIYFAMPKQYFYIKIDSNKIHIRLANPDVAVYLPCPAQSYLINNHQMWVHINFHVKPYELFEPKGKGNEQILKKMTRGYGLATYWSYQSGYTYILDILIET